MKLIEQSHELLSTTSDIPQMIEAAGRTCYKSEDRITSDSANKFVRGLVKAGHHAMIEFGDIIIRFVTNRGVTHELVRHRLCSFAQESTRYVNYASQQHIQFILPSWSTTLRTGLYKKIDEEQRVLYRETPAEYEFIKGCLQSEKQYNRLIELGWKAQQAREVLPNALKTEIVVKANAREWRHILKLRTAKAAHPQMRDLMIPVLLALRAKYPSLYGDIDTEN
jgi:thymidylate synthase (FAD)